MRSLTLVGTLVLSTACASNNSDLQYRGTLDTETNSIVLFEGGEAGHAGMSGTTCVVTSDGGLADDVDVENDDSETVVDGSNRNGDDMVLARSGNSLVTIQRITDEFGFTTMGITGQVSAPAAVRAAFVADGLVAASSCGVDFLTSSGDLVASQSFSDLGCTGMEPAFDVDRSTSTVYLSSGANAVAVHPNGVTALAGAGDLMTLVSADGALAFADRGANEVRFVGLDGVTRWTAQLPGPVVDLEDMADRGTVAVMVDLGNAGQMVLLDTATGLVERSFALPATAEMFMAANGEVVALQLPDEVHYYTIR
jgi:hypothetical protein